jgi:hypothetical protein
MNTHFEEIVKVDITKDTEFKETDQVFIAHVQWVKFEEIKHKIDPPLQLDLFGHLKWKWEGYYVRRVEHFT